MDKENVKMTMAAAEKLIRHAGIKKFLERESEKISALIRLRVARIINGIEKELEIYQTEITRIGKQYASKINDKPEMSENGGYKIDPMNLNKAMDEIDMIGKEEFELNVPWLEINFEKDIKDWNLTGSEISALLLLSKDG